MKAATLHRFVKGEFVRVRSGAWMPKQIPAAVKVARIGKVNKCLTSGASVRFPGYPSTVDYFTNELQRCNSKGYTKHAC